MNSESENKQRPLFPGNYRRGPARGRKMRETLYRGTCRGCGFNKTIDGARQQCHVTGLPVSDKDACRAPMPPRKRKKRMIPKTDQRTVGIRTDVADLAWLRRGLGLTARELASRIGISYSYFRDLESGLRHGSIRTFARWLIELDKEREQCAESVSASG